MPDQVQLAGNVRHGAAATSPAYIPGKAIGIERGFCQKVEPFSFHFSTMTAKHSSNLDLQIDACVATREIANSSKPLVVPARVSSAAGVADCFFEQRTSVMTRALESPKMPRIFSRGRKNGNRYASSRRLRLVETTIVKSSPFLERAQIAFCLIPQGLQRISC